ncbi:MAG: M1 family aminopeptidase [Acidobacteria bacterium]|nr:M1 family aminopeptidase [Acidobacteriota bacterium]
MRIIFSFLLLASLLRGQAVDNYLAQINGLQLDPQQCYRVRDLFLEREDVKFYFTDGLLIFAEPVDGREVGAFFIAQEATDSAEILVIPPTGQERYSMASFTGDGVLNRPFNHVMLLFSDDTADVLRAGLQASSAAGADPDEGAALSRKWSPVFRNLLNGASIRIAVDVLADMPKSAGFLAAAVGSAATRYDVIIDPRGEDDHISIGQAVRKNNAIYEEIWSRFSARSFREGTRKPVGFGGRVEAYDLDVSLADDLSIAVVASTRLVVTEPGRRTFPFTLSRRVEISEITVDGVPAEFLHESGESGMPGDLDYGTALLVLPEAPEPGAALNIRFRYHGRVVDHTENDIYLVGSRTSWYPRGRFEPSDYRLTFHYPASLDLRATGMLRDTTQAGQRKTSVYETEHRIQLAGFNLGRYVSEVREIGDYRLEILANREVESRFQPQDRIIATTPSRGRRRSPINQATQNVLRIPAEQIAAPAEQIQEIADTVTSSFEYFLSQFGPPVSRTVSVTPIPNGYGQGFPGLVYAPTLSYLDVTNSPLANLPDSQRAFYKEALFPHEISHQWWGNLVRVDARSDSWLAEALATYSALLYLEQQSGPGTIERFLGYYLEDLWRENAEGNTNESAGPIVLGERLTSSRFPNATASIVYGKGAWIMHMIRAAIGPASFAKLLSALPKDFADRDISTDGFREAAAAYLPAGSPDPAFKEFFDQWVYGIGMPRLKVRWSQQRGRVSGVIEQEGVPDYFSVPVTLELRTAGEVIRKELRTDGPETEFSFAIPQKVEQVRLDPDRTVLALIEQPQ